MGGFAKEPTYQFNRRLTRAEIAVVEKALAEYRGKPVVHKDRENVADAENQIRPATPVEREGIPVTDFLAAIGAKVSPTEPAEDFSKTTEWRTDGRMIEIDRGCVYEMTGDGYPDEAASFSSKHPQLWAKMFSAKCNKQMSKYNEIMQYEVWPLIRGEE